MTKSDAIRRVTSEENQDVNGMALCAEVVFRKELEMTKQLREQQAVYVASLPTEPMEVISAAMKILHPDGEEFPNGTVEALHLAIALEGMVQAETFDMDVIAQNTTRYLSRRIAVCLIDLTRELERMSDILMNAQTDTRSAENELNAFGKR